MEKEGEKIWKVIGEKKRKKIEKEIEAGKEM